MSPYCNTNTRCVCYLCPCSGNTLKNIEKECCAKIMIRGKGSVKEGKVGRKDGQMLPGEDEPLHALVTANTMENVKKAVEQVRSHPHTHHTHNPSSTTSLPFSVH